MHKTLYARTSAGAVQTWTIEQDGANYRIISGQLEGKKVTTEWTTAKPKNAGKANATTGETQADLEVAALYKKKLKTKYFEDINDIDEQKYIKPMLAKEYTDYKHKIDWEQGVIVQIKYNGVRVIATKHGLFSRTGERYMSIPHISEQLKPFFENFPDAVLDGEAFNYDYRKCLNELVSLVRQTKDVTEEDLKASAEMVEYWVYDGYGFGDVTEATPYEERLEELDYTLAYNFVQHGGEAIGIVKSDKVHSEAEVFELYESYLAQNHEGAMIRNPNSAYEHKRSANLLKLKPVQDAEFTILDIQEGTGDWSGKAKVITLMDANGKHFDASFKGSMPQAIDCLQNKNRYIGKQVTVYFFGYTGLGTPNYAQFDINNCFKL